MEIRIGDQDWGFGWGIDIDDWERGLVFGIWIEDQNWRFVIGNMDWGLGLKIVIGD